jgi:indole-3-glycerol phosphate synthase
MNILDEIAERTRQRVADEKRTRSLESMRQVAEEARRHDCDGCNAEDPGLSAEEFASARILAPCSFPFEGMLERPGVQVIAEVKRASPSKGLIAPDFPYLQIARDYEAAGAAAISCLTEPYWFQGRDEYLAEIAREVRIPVLRKDFVVDEYMVYQAKALGARAVLLICAILDDAQLSAYRQLADELQMSALVEAHTAEEVQRAVACGARVIGVNNRDLKTFNVDMAAARELRDMVPAHTLFVSESGVKSAADVEAARAMRADAVLVGETLMRADDKRAKLAELRGEA